MFRMRFFLIYILIFITLESFSTNYYFSSSSGNDSYTVIQAQNRNTPWKTIDKLNASMHLFAPGDSILFKRGDTFTGQIILGCSGTSNNKIVFSAYGTGKAPNLKGTQPVTSWNKFDDNIWVADFPAMGSKITNLLIDGKSQHIGRYPNAGAANNGYLNIDSHIGKTSITSSSIAGYNWTGAEAVIRTRRWIINRVIIQSQESNTLKFSSPTTYEVMDNYGFFIQNHVSTLIQDGDWCFNASAKKIYLFYKSDPNIKIIEATSFPSNFHASNKHSFSIMNIEFSGSLNASIDISNSKYFKIQENFFSESGDAAVKIKSCSNIDFLHNIITRTNNNALVIDECTDVTINNNNIRGTGIRSGMCSDSDLQSIGIFVAGSNITCVENIIDSTGYIGVFYKGNNILIKNNYIDHFCMIMDDGGGLYTSSDGKTTNSNRVLESNIILNGIGAGFGTDNQDFVSANGIYLDDRADHVALLNNSIANCSGYGIFIHNANNFTLNGNTVFNNSHQLGFLHDNIAPDFPIRNGFIEKNIFYSKLKSQQVANFRTIKNDIPQFGIFDNNYYCRPVNDFSTFYLRYLGTSSIVSELIDLRTWKEAYKHDLNSLICSYKIPVYNIVNYKSPNKYPNGTFINNISGWSCWSNYNNSNAIWDNSGNLDNGSMKLNFSVPSGKEGGFMLVSGKIGEVVKDENYILKFSMISSSPEKKLSIIMRKTTLPFNEIAATQSVFVTQERKEYELLFTPNTSESDVRIDFKIDEDDEICWIDNVELYQADIKKTITEDSVKFFYNPTNTLMKVSDNNYYLDVRGTKYYNFEIQPFSSLILLNVAKEYFDNNASSYKVTEITVTGSNGSTTITSDKGTLQLSASILPTNANNKAVTWSITNGTGQAIINTSGLVSAIAYGTVTAKATANDGSGITGTLAITISNQLINVTSITVTGEDGSTTITTNNGTLQLSVAALPNNATSKAVTWTIQNGTGRATIGSTGVVTAISDGTVIATATATDGSGIKSDLIITISNQITKVTGITVTGAGGSSTITYVKGTLQLSANVLPTTAINKTVTWTVQNGTGAASISSTGLVTAISNGTVSATAAATDGSGVKGDLIITISGQTVAVNGITVTCATSSSSSITSNKGTLQLIANVLPAVASNKSVSWTIQNGTGQASISSTGLVTAISNGTVTATATAADGSGVKGSLIITISGQTITITGILVSGADGTSIITSNKGTLQLIATVSPSTATDKTINWSIQNGTGQASINITGRVTAITDGSVTATASATDGSGVTGSLVIIISGQSIAVTRITIQGTGGKSTINSIGETLQLFANVFPTNASNKAVTWSIQHGTGQASISSSGLVTAIVNGTVTAIATAADGSGVKGSLIITIATSTVMVSAITVYSDDFVNSVSGIGDKLQLYASVFPGSAYNQAVSWTVTNSTGLATINEKGLLTALGYGQVTVVAKAKDGSGVTGTLIVYISEQITGMDETQEKPYLLKNDGSTLSIQFKEPSGFKQIFLYNLSGNLLFADKIFSNPMIIDITSLLQGIYIVQLLDFSGKKEAIKFYK